MLYCMSIADLQLMAFLPPSTLDALLYFQTITLPRSNIGDGFYFRKQAAHNLTVCELRGADDWISADRTPSRVSNQSSVFNSRRFARFFATSLCLPLPLPCWLMLASYYHTAYTCYQTACSCVAWWWAWLLLLMFSYPVVNVFAWFYPYFHCAFGVAVLSLLTEEWYCQGVLVYISLHWSSGVAGGYLEEAWATAEASRACGWFGAR